MRDPHVQKLHYEVRSGDSISYRDPAPVAFSNHLGDFELSDNKLSITPSEHFADEDNARKVIEPFLKAWEIEADLKSNIGMIRFKFDQTELIDRNPPPPGTPKVIEAKAASMGIAGASASAHLTYGKYPDPPKEFRTTTEVEMAYRRWINFRTRKEPLPGMANFVLTLLESMAGCRKKAAKVFNIHYSVLRKIGELSSTKGDQATARKVGRKTRFQDFSGSEKHWLEQAVRLVIYRLGEHASGAVLRPITLTDLPTL